MYAFLICDDPDEAAILTLVLQRVGLSVTQMGDLERVLRALEQRPPEMLIWALRGALAEDQIRRIRNEFETLIVIISPSIEEDALYHLFDLGADLVLTRPYSARLLTMQLRALLRRSRGSSPLELPALRAGKLTLDPSTRGIQVEGRAPRHLTHLEFRLLYTLMMHPGQTLPSETIVERVWGYSGEGSMELARGLISRLRAKIEDDPKNPRYIVTVPGVGYRLDLALPEIPRSTERKAAT